MIVFFVRRYNDIDHVAPVVYKWAGAGSRDTLVLCNDPAYDIGADYRLAFLRDRCGVEVDYSYRAWRPSLAHRLAAAWLCGRDTRGADTDDTADGFTGRLTRRWLFDRPWARGLLERLGASVVVFDWAKPHQFVTGALLEAARELGLPTVGLPHGLKLWTLEAMRDESFEIPSYRDFFPYDYLVAPNALFADLFVEGGVPREKVHVLGSARFCDEWERIYEGLSPDGATLPPDDGRLKVVLMEGSHRYGTGEAVFVDTVNRLARLPFVQLIVKPKTASSGADRLAAGFDAGVALDPATPSLTLCRWADAVIMMCTSIAFEVFQQDKVLIYPKYLYTKRSIFEELRAGWVVGSWAEMEKALRRLHGQRGYRPYPDAAVRAFLRATVSGGHEGPDVLGRYVAFLEAVAAGRPPSVVEVA